MNKTILITGGAGFIGSNLAETLSRQPDNEVVVVDNLSTGHVDYLPNRPNLTFIQADVNQIGEIAPVFRHNDFDYVYHYAAVVGVERTLSNPLNVLEDIQGIKNILELSKDGVKRVLYSSSSEVYGEPVEMPQHEETTPLNSRLPYAVVKNVGEAFLRSYQREFGLSYTIFRFFNTFGPHQSPDFVVSRFLDRALAGDDIPVYGDGSQTRTFCYIEDNVQATIEALDNGLAENQTINIGSPNEISILNLAKKVLELTGNRSKIDHRPPLKEGDMTRRRPDATKMMELLGRPLTPLDAGLRKLIEFKMARP